MVRKSTIKLKKAVAVFERFSGGGKWFAQPVS